MSFLSPLGLLYGKIADARNALYDRGTLRSYSLGAKTVSVGNITTGGTGKTPLVALVVNILAEHDEKVCILSRGFGRKNERSRVLVSDGENVLTDAETGGDEPVELARRLLGKAVVIADADRVSAAKWALDKFGITAFVLDDGFQHRRAERDLDIVCIDATDPFGGSEMLPAGRLREPVDNLRRADAIVVTRSDQAVEGVSLKARIDAISRFQVFTCKNRISAVTALEEFPTKTKSLQRDPTEWENNVEVDWSGLRATGGADSEDDAVRIMAFCALGNPQSFFMQVDLEFGKEAMNDEFDLSSTRAFPDHHYYNQAGISALEKQARECNVDALVTTAKDAVKLRQLKFKLPCFVVEIEPVIEDASGFRALILSPPSVS